jgi:hypothetical protein
MWKFKNNTYSTRINALKDFGTYVFDFCLSYKYGKEYNHEQKLFYALNVIENKTPEQWEELYTLGLSIWKSEDRPVSEIKIEETMGIDSFIYDHESSWGDTGNEIPEMLKYYEYHTQKQHS